MRERDSAVGIAGVLLYVCLLSACRKDAAQPESAGDVLARVGTATIHVDDFQAEVVRRRESNRPVPGKEELLAEMVAFEALRQRAENDALATDPQVQRKMAKVLISEWKERRVLPELDAVQVTDEEVRAEYERRIADYTRPAQVRLAALHLQGDRRMSDARREALRARMAEARRRAIEQPAPGGRGAAAQGFGAVAIEFSDDQASRYRGGDIGWMAEGATASRWPRGVLETGFALEKGQVSDVIERDGDLYLVMKSDCRERVVTPFEKVASSLRQRLLMEKRRERHASLVGDVLSCAAAETNHAALAALRVSMPESAVARKKGDASLPLPPTGPRGVGDEL